MIRYRALITTALLFLVFVALLVKLFSIQVMNKDFYAFKAEKQQYKPQIIKAERGTIKDSNGEVLCFTQDNTSFFVDTRMMKPDKVDKISSVFAKVFGKSKNHYKRIINDGTRNVCLERKVSVEKAAELKKNFIEGLFYEEDFTREYPYGSLAAHVLGFVNSENSGVSGVEKICDNELTGTDGFYVFENDVLGREISFDEKQSKPAVPGDDVYLTINKNYQKILDTEIYNGIKKFEADSAVGIIMNPNTGEILALSNYPCYDPANMKSFSVSSRRDRAITDTYEPGSTIKSITMSILFDQKLVKEKEIVNTENGKYKIKNVRIYDDHEHDYLTVRGVLEQSSNIGISKLSTRIQDNTLYKYFRDFGFGNLTTIELPGEVTGILQKPKDSKYTAITKAFLSFGYGISVTPMQLITAYSSLINGGTLYKPYVVKEIKDYKGNILQQNSPEMIRTVIKKSTSDIIRDLMIGVVEEGTGTEAQLDNVLVGGKTGTAQVLENGQYTNRKHNSSFVGFFPADHPQVICLIVVFAPRKGMGYGGLVAAPIFHDVAEKLLETDLNLAPNRKKITRNKHFIEELLTDRRSVSGKDSHSFLNISENEKPISLKKRFYKDGISSMPDLKNHSLRDALAMLNEMGVEYKVNGTGKVVSQSIKPGSSITKDSVCYLTCKPPEVLNSIRIN